MFQPDGGIMSYFYIFLNFPMKSAFLNQKKTIKVILKNYPLRVKIKSLRDGPEES